MKEWHNDAGEWIFHFYMWVFYQLKCDPSSISFSRLFTIDFHEIVWDKWKKKPVDTYIGKIEYGKGCENWNFIAKSLRLFSEIKKDIKALSDRSP